jgi:hypothetical protein
MPDMEQLKLLMTYTLFHIGLYASLTSALLGFLAFSPKSIRRDLYPYMVSTLGCFVMSGIFGGIIASSIPRFDDWDSFRNTDMGPIWPLWAQGILGKFETVAALEHWFFWLGMMIAIGGIAFHSRKKD